MGERGPVPKRSTERRRRNVESQVEPVHVTTDVVAIPAPPAVDDWHEIAREWYESLSQSGQAQFYEPSDWATARYLAEAMSRNLNQGQKFSSMLFSSVLSGMAELLTTEGARRRARLEIEREAPQAPASVALMEKYRKAASSE